MHFISEKRYNPQPRTDGWYYRIKESYRDLTGRVRCRVMLNLGFINEEYRPEDIGRVKIPRLLRKKVGEGLQIDMVSGSDFPKDLSAYDLIIHCGACMFNRKHVMNRLESASLQEVPMTNYGITLAHLMGILDKIVY